MSAATQTPETPAPVGEDAASLIDRARARRMEWDVAGWKDAVSLLLEAREKAPADARVAAELGWIYSFWGSRRALSGQESASYRRLAFVEAASAASAAPDLAAAHRALSAALAFGPRANPDARRKEAAAALELNPYDGESCYEAWRASGYSPDDTLILKAFALEPRLAAAYVDLGAALARAGRLNEAAHFLGKALEINPRHSVALFDLTAVLLRRGDLDEARRIAQRAGQAHPDDPLARRAMILAGLVEPEVSFL